MPQGEAKHPWMSPMTRFRMRKFDVTVTGTLSLGLGSPLTVSFAREFVTKGPTLHGATPVNASGISVGLPAREILCARMVGVALPASKYVLSWDGLRI